MEEEMEETLFTDIGGDSGGGGGPSNKKRKCECKKKCESTKHNGAGRHNLSTVEKNKIPSCVKCLEDGFDTKSNSLCESNTGDTSHYCDT